MESCVLCYGGERDVCSSCVQSLLALSQEELKRAHTLALERGFIEKARAISMAIEEDEYVSEAGKTRSNMVRERPVRTSRPAHYETRA
jgi:hypothetical protein